MPSEILPLVIWAFAVLVLTIIAGVIDISKILRARRRAKTAEVISTLKGLPEEITIRPIRPIGFYSGYQHSLQRAAYQWLLGKVKPSAR